MLYNMIIEILILCAVMTSVRALLDIAGRAKNAQSRNAINLSMAYWVVLGLVARMQHVMHTVPIDTQ